MIPLDKNSKNRGFRLRVNCSDQLSYRGKNFIIINLQHTSETEKDSEWQKTPCANLVRYKSSGIYFARFRVKGKLIRRSLKTGQMSVAKLRLGDLEKQERQRAEHQTAVGDGTMAFADAQAIYQQGCPHDGHLARQRRRREAPTA